MSPLITSTVRTGAGRRGMLLLVGDHALFETLQRRAEDATILRCGNLFAALGHLATPSSPADNGASGSGSKRIASIVIDEGQMSGESLRAIDALRRVDPSVPLILLGAEIAGAPRLYDEVVAPESPLEQIAERLGVTLSEDRGAEPALSGGTHEERVEVRPAAGPEAPSEPLGDTDLVEALMNDPDGVREAALLLIRQQTRVSEIEFIPADVDAEFEIPDESFLAVRRGEHLLGYLRVGCDEKATTPPLSNFGGWADWLAQWLDLDRAYRGYRIQANQDELTGAYNRRYFNDFLLRSIETGRKLRRPVTIMLFDLDNFKRYNDHYGHEAGDLVLSETVRLLKTVIRGGDCVCRIGGDEFVVIFADPEEPRELGSRHPVSVETIVLRFQEQLRTMKLILCEGEAPPTLTVSAGLATYPWDGDTPQTLLRRADELALESKRRGKNLITFGPGVES